MAIIMGCEVCQCSEWSGLSLYPECAPTHTRTLASEGKYGISGGSEHDISVLPYLRYSTYSWISGQLFAGYIYHQPC